MAFERWGGYRRSFEALSALAICAALVLLRVRPPRAH
jgi:hypothetical protein